MSAGDGGYTPRGLYKKIFIMHFNAQNAVLEGTRNSKIKFVSNERELVGEYLL